MTLELGGKSPNIVFADSDPQTAFEGSANGVFWNQGEICSRTRVFVERPLYDDAVNAFVDRAVDRRARGPTRRPRWVRSSSAEQQERVERFIEIGSKEATLAKQG